jgi:hypothetical protein
VKNILLPSLALAVLAHKQQKLRWRSITSRHTELASQQHARYHMQQQMQSTVIQSNTALNKLLAAVVPLHAAPPSTQPSTTTPNHTASTVGTAALLACEALHTVKGAG